MIPNRIDGKLMFFKSTINRLLFTSSPSAITGFVITVIVNSIKAGIWWPWTHVGIKLSKIIFPFLAHCYATTSIIIEGMAFRIKASGLSLCPGTMFTSIAFAMFYVNAFHGASATFYTAVGKGIGCDGFDVSAITLANPMDSICSFGSSPQYC